VLRVRYLEKTHGHLNFQYVRTKRNHRNTKKRFAKKRLDREKTTRSLTGMKLQYSVRFALSLLMINGIAFLSCNSKKESDAERWILDLVTYDNMNVTWGELQTELNSVAPKCSICHGPGQQPPDLADYAAMSGPAWSKCAMRDSTNSRFYIALTPVGVMHHINPSIANRVAPVVKRWIDFGCQK